MIEMFMCPSYYDDDRVLIDCECGRCVRRINVEVISTSSTIPVGTPADKKQYEEDMAMDAHRYEDNVNVFGL